MVEPITVAKAAAALLSNEKTRKGIGWAVVVVLSPIIVVVALLCSLGSGTASHNIAAAQLCFQDGPLPDNTPAEYRVCVEQMRAHFAELEESISAIEAMIEDDSSLDPIRVKAVFYSLYFGGEVPLISQFASCFATSEIHTRTVTVEDDEGNEIEVEQTYTVAVPIGDMATVYANIASSLGGEITEEQKNNADTVLEAQDGILRWNGKRLSVDTSDDAHNYFSQNDDGHGLERGALVGAILSLLEKRDKNHQARWNKIWPDTLCQKYRRPEHEDFWLWNHDFYNAPVEDLRHIAGLIGVSVNV